MRTLTIAAMALVASLTAAHAQNAVSGANASGTQNVNTGASSGSSSGVLVNDNRTSTVKNPDKIEVNGPPDFVMSNVQHSNPCMVAINAGVSVMGFGGGVGTGIQDEECDDRNTFATLMQAGLPDVAKAFWCEQNEEVAAAFAAAGKSCYPTNDNGPDMAALQVIEDDRRVISTSPVYGPGDPVRVGALANFRD